MGEDIQQRVGAVLVGVGALFALLNWLMLTGRRLSCPRISATALWTLARRLSGTLVSPASIRR